MIYPVKVWTRKGLRKLLRLDKQKSMSAIQALVKHQDNYKLSKNERIRFDRMNVDYVIKPAREETHKYPEHAYRRTSINEHAQNRKYNVYKITCVGCGAKAERYKESARYCSNKCYRKYYQKRYTNEKGERNETGCQAV